MRRPTSDTIIITIPPLAIPDKAVSGIPSNINYPNIADIRTARNMQSAIYNLQYANSIPSLASPLATILASNGATTAASMTAEQLNNIRALLTSNDTYDFASAAWFLTTQCSPDVRAGLQSGSLAGWQVYLTECIGTTATSGRQAIWSTAITVFGTSPNRKRW